MPHVMIEIVDISLQGHLGWDGVEIWEHHLRGFFPAGSLVIKHHHITPLPRHDISLASATVAIVPRYRPLIRVAPAAHPSIRLPSVHSSTAFSFSSSILTSRLPGADRRPKRRQSRRMDRRQQDR